MHPPSVIDLGQQVSALQEPRRLANFRGLLKSISQSDKHIFRVSFADEGNPDRQTEHIAGWYGDVRITGYCRWPGEIASA